MGSRVKGLPGTLGGAKRSSRLEPEGGGIVWNWSYGGRVEGQDRVRG